MSQMMPDMEDYFRGFVPPRDELLKEMENEAEREHIPIVGPVVGELLFLLARVSGAARLLELGTAIGYSAIYLARGAEPAGGRVLTLEHDPAMAMRARTHFAKAGLEDRIEVKEGEALALMEHLTGSFDLIFLDIDKESYVAALPHCLRLLKAGGLLLADNVGFAGAAAFNQEIFNQPQWRAVHLLCLLPRHSPEKDGLCLAVRVA